MNKVDIYMEAWRRMGERDVAGLLALVTEDFSLCLPESLPVGRDAMPKIIHEWSSAFSDWAQHGRVIRYLEDADHLVALHQENMLHDGVFTIPGWPPVQPTGRRVNPVSTEWLQFDEHRIRSWGVLYDPETFLAAIRG